MLSFPGVVTFYYGMTLALEYHPQRNHPMNDFILQRPLLKSIIEALIYLIIFKKITSYYLLDDFIMM